MNYRRRVLAATERFVRDLRVLLELRTRRELIEAIESGRPLAPRPRPLPAARLGVSGRASLAQELDAVIAEQLKSLGAERAERAEAPRSVASRAPKGRPTASRAAGRSRRRSELLEHVTEARLEPPAPALPEGHNEETFELLKQDVVRAVAELPGHDAATVADHLGQALEAVGAAVESLVATHRLTEESESGDAQLFPGAGKANVVRRRAR